MVVLSPTVSSSGRRMGFWQIAEDLGKRTLALSVGFFPGALLDVSVWLEEFGSHSVAYTKTV